MDAGPCRSAKVLGASLGEMLTNGVHDNAQYSKARVCDGVGEPLLATLSSVNEDASRLRSVCPYRPNPAPEGSRPRKFMRITIVLGPFLGLPPASCGAVERVWLELGSEFAARGHDVCIVSKRCEFTHVGKRFGNLELIFLRGYRRRESFWWNAMCDALYSISAARVCRHGDIVVTNSLLLPFAFLLTPGAGKLVVHIARMPKGQLRYYPHNASIHTVSNAVLKAIERECPRLALRTFVIPYPVDSEVFAPPRITRDYRGSSTFLYVGRVHPEKGIDVLLEAFARLVETQRDVLLRIVGPWRTEEGGGGTAYLTRIKSRAKSLPIEFLEPIYDKQALAEVYRNADYFCYPSMAETGETFGLAALEAMSTGLIPIVSDLECFRDFISDRVNGLVFSRGESAVPDLAAAMNSVIADVDLRTRLCTALETTAGEFRIPKVADRYLKEFEVLLAHSGS